MSDTGPEIPKTNVDLLRLSLVSEELAEKLVEAATSTPDYQEALAATKGVLLSKVEETLTKLKNGKN